MTGKLLASASALVLALAMSHAAVAGNFGDNTANGEGNDNVLVSDDDQVGANNTNNLNRRDRTITDNAVGNNNKLDSGNSANTSFNLTIGNVKAAVSVEALRHTNNGQTFNGPVAQDGAELEMEAELGDNAVFGAAGVVQTFAQTGFQPQLQQGSSIGAVGTVNLAGGDNGS